ncbi:MAG TPA: TenA family transcriptional regulator [Cytophagales bacterium]|nr:TenA family transcriptional regulator [Cytophagales bacterium]HAA22463.1 TenA family transcriptional regulator [Cytophagales bacterium]HAP58967.1 TenA family transcriptional regulator [Cytophagales bacterium]
MKSNRRITLSSETIAKHELSTEPPAPDSLFWKLWKANLQVAEEALNTDFVQGIKAGTLSPTTYGGFNVSDAYYCFRGAEDYATAVSRAEHPVLKAFLQQKHDSYQSYNETFPDTWHVKDGDSIVPTEVCQQYSAYETQVVSTEEPIYALVVMLPCEYLWAWLGAQLSPPAAGNVYADWITGNDYPSGAYAMGNFLEAWRQKYGIDEAKAMDIYTKAITFEYQNFANP